MDIILVVTLIIQLLAALMVLYTFYRISERKFPQLDSLERYHLMRERYERLRWSLVFVSALILVQLAGVVYYFVSGSLPLLQLLISDFIVIALIILLSRIYRMRGQMQELDLKMKKK
jgi:4-hydroxybenzoate polyprenyltransferase